MGRRSARTHGDAGTLELFAHCAPMNAQLGTDLAQSPTLGIQVGCTLNVHRDTVTSINRLELAHSKCSAYLADKPRRCHTVICWTCRRRELRWIEAPPGIQGMGGRLPDARISFLGFFPLLRDA
jgi:hypothetical protein